MELSPREELVIYLTEYHMDKYGFEGYDVVINRRLKRIESQVDFSAKKIEFSADFIGTSSLTAILRTMVHELGHLSVPEDGNEHSHLFERAVDKLWETF